AIPFPSVDETPAAELPQPGVLGSNLTEIAGAALLLLVALTLLFMGRGRRRPVEITAPPALEAPEPEPVPVGAGVEMAALAPTRRGLHDDVVDLVQSQPEEIAALLRSWLADRR